jgi:hypothetical protein
MPASARVGIASGFTAMLLAEMPPTVRCNAGYATAAVKAIGETVTEL